MTPAVRKTDYWNTVLCRDCGRKIIRTYTAKEMDLDGLNKLLAKLNWSDVEQVTPILIPEGILYFVVYQDEIASQELVATFEEPPHLNIETENLFGREPTHETPLGEQIDSGTEEADQNMTDHQEELLL